MKCVVVGSGGVVEKNGESGGRVPNCDEKIKGREEAARWIGRAEGTELNETVGFLVLCACFFMCAFLCCCGRVVCLCARMRSCARS